MADTRVYPLGRNVRHDPASRAFNLADRVAATLPTKAIRWERNGPVLDQGQIGSCTANAALGLMMTAPFSKGVQYTEADALAFYHDETVADHIPGTYPPDDPGSDGLTAMQVLKTRGLIRSYSHAFNPTVAVASLTHGPIAVGVPWLASMYEPKRGRIIVDKRSAVDGGHEFVVDGWDPKTQRVHMTNSWSDQWGTAGGATIALGDFSWLLGQQGDAVQPTS